MQTPARPNRPARHASAAAARIATLDPETSYEEIARFLYAYEFSWDIERSLEFALFRTYAVPAISRVLSRTGEFECRSRKRYDDTELLLCEVMEHGLDSPRGSRSIARMNDMHGRFGIDNAAMLYVLSTFVCEPIRWLERFGRRPMTERERRAWFLYYRGLGERMGIREIPLSLDELTRLNVDYEAAHFRYADTNRRIGSITRDMLIGFYLPRPLVRFGRPAVHALLDRPLSEGLGFPVTPAWLGRSVVAALRLRAGVLRLLPPRHQPRLLTQVPRPTYPNGYRIEELGTFRATPRSRSER